MGITNYTLPEFVFLDGNSHLGDSLKGRTVLQHVRSYTILEVVPLDSVELSNFTSPTYEFIYTNPAGVGERHMFAVHFSLEEDNLPEIFIKCERFYLEYLHWEDGNIMEDYERANN